MWPAGSASNNFAPGFIALAASAKNVAADGISCTTANDSEATERALMFLPALLPDGIEPADPMIQFRNKAYPVSYERRHQSPAMVE
jgi:hypothetical protein